ncbi:RtcB family protein [Microcoleus sp. herbarium14]|uniref:RtcB family protein n=1 Tax=Microcoleus sp. herbarium14 TaxID=3055439 RepID=UPI002FD60FE0
MQQPKNLNRLLRALSRQGLDVSYSNKVYSISLNSSLKEHWHFASSTTAEVLLPEDFAVEVKALKQLANLANVRHPQGGCVCRACATPDFHPGDAGVAIGSIVQTTGMVIPAAVGSDINCGMRLHVADLSIEQFLSQRDRFVELLKGDYFFGTRDVSMTAKTARAMFQHGIPGWLDAMLDRATGSVVNSDFEQLATECDSLRDSCARAYFSRRFHEWRCQMGSRRISPKRRLSQGWRARYYRRRQSLCGNSSG